MIRILYGLRICTNIQIAQLVITGGVYNRMVNLARVHTRPIVYWCQRDVIFIYMDIFDIRCFLLFQIERSFDSCFVKQFFDGEYFYVFCHIEYFPDQ